MVTVMLAAVRLRSRQWVAAVIFSLCLLAFLTPQAAFASDPLYDVCIEDGGHAECTAPQITLTTYYAQGGVALGPVYSEMALYNLIQDYPTYCSSSTSPMPPFAWTPDPPSSGSYYTTPITQIVTDGNCQTDPQGPFTQYWTGAKELTLVCPPSPWIENSTVTANYPHGFCWRPVIQRCQSGQCPHQYGKPIDPIDGNEQETQADFMQGATRLEFARTYNYAGTNVGPGQPNGATGQGWNHSYERRLWFYPGGAVRAIRPDGNHRVFTPVSGGGYQEFGTAVDQLVATQSGWQLIDSQDTTETYDVNGNLLSITYRGGATLNLTYSTTSTPTNIAPVPGLLITVSDAFGHQLNFAYNSLSQIATMTDPNGGIYSYSYTGALLTSVTYPDNTSRQYLYNESAYTQNTNLPYAFTGIIDETGTRYATISYNSSGLAYSSVLAGGVNQFQVLDPYYSDNAGYGYAYLKDPLGNERYLNFTAVGGVAKFSGVSQVCPYCTDNPKSVTYDANGNVATRQDFNANENTYTYNLTRNLETSRTEAYGSSVARTITTAWDPAWRQPDLITEPNRTTAFTYDSLGNTLTKTITDTTVTPNVTRIWTYTYDSYGRILTARGPRTDLNSTTTYTYYTCTSGSQCGQVQTVSDAAGNVTTYNTYNGYGQPLTITDPNGVVTTITYDGRQRITSRQVGAETTTYSYYPTGLLKQVTLPDDSYVLYTYDSAHRLTQISDEAGNSIQYTLDVMGNRTAEKTYDPSNTLHHTHTRVYNSVDQLYQDINAANTSAVTTTYVYDSNSNQTAIDAPLSRNTSQTYDALNRLSSVTDPTSRRTGFAYDANDNLSSVTDPRSLITSYTHNGFGDLTQQASPDTGTGSNTYDSGGNLSVATDARGSTASYTYDALNRVTSITYQNSQGVTDQTLVFGYDFGTNGKGRLTSAADANHSMSWTYDFLGRVTGKAIIVGTVTEAVGYGYTNGDLASVTTPSGQAVVYGYNSNHQVTSITVNGTTVLSGVTYEPFGAVNGWTWGDGTSVTRTVNGDGIVTQIVTAGVTLAYTYDNANRITGISDSSNGALSWTYGYDLDDRLTSASTSANTYGWTYDANGNRLTQTGTNASTFTVSSSGNRLSSISGALSRTYAYDAASDTQSYGSNAFTYNNRGRMMSTSASSTNYLYDALGHLLEKSGSLGTTIFMYDESDHLLGEYDGSGNLIEETVWLGDIPVATLRPNGSGGINVFYVHTDHLNAPRKISQPTTGTLAWRWDTEPFGTTSPNQNPGGLGTFVYNERFPGQYYQAETGLNYNYFRDYDPQAGSYIESDPLGLAGGGFSTFAYVGGDPIDETDPFGLAPPGGHAIPPTPVLPGVLDFPLNPSAFGWPQLAWQQIDAWLTKAGQAVHNACSANSKASNCRALYDTIVRSCWSISNPRKRQRCFEAAKSSYEECMAQD